MNRSGVGLQVAIVVCEVGVGEDPITVCSILQVVCRKTAQHIQELFVILTAGDFR